MAKVLVGRGGLEPPTSRLSGARSNHLSYRPDAVLARICTGKSEFGGAYRDRTDDLLNANQALSQLSSGPERKKGLAGAMPTILAIALVQWPSPPQNAPPERFVPDKSGSVYEGI